MRAKHSLQIIKMISTSFPNALPLWITSNGDTDAGFAASNGFYYSTQIFHGQWFIGDAAPSRRLFTAGRGRPVSNFIGGVVPQEFVTGNIHLS